MIKIRLRVYLVRPDLWNGDRLEVKWEQVLKYHSKTRCHP